MGKISLFFDCRRLKEGRGQVAFSFSAHGKTAYHYTGVYLHVSEWRDGFVVKNKLSKKYNIMFAERLSEYEACVEKLRIRGVDFVSGAQMRDDVLREVDSAAVVPVEPLFLEHLRDFAERHENRRTKEIYLATESAIMRFSSRACSITFSEINRKWLDDFFVFLGKTSPSVNARGIHLRNIRAVFNDAIDNDLISSYPFRRYKIRQVETPKRNVGEEILRKVFFANVDVKDQRYVDAFYLSFLLIGINVVDLCYLEKTDMRGGRIFYNRKKTQKLYSIKIEPEAKSIIDKYKGDSLLLSFAEGFKSYRTFAMKMNKFLQTIHPRLTTYVARHSWATIASKLDIPDDTISFALGHSSRNSTTSIYIERDTKKIDVANRKVIDHVVYGK